MEINQINELEQLRIAAKEVKETDKKDYAEQIQKWNNYMSVLAVIDNKTRYMSGVRLKRNIKSNIGWKYGEMAFAINVACLIVGIVLSVITSVIVLYAGLFVSLPLLLPLFGVFAITGYYNLTRSTFREKIGLPRTIALSASPRLHINELQYARSNIKGIPERVYHDPIVRLPKAQIKIPRKFIAQESIHKVMTNFGDVKLE